MVLCAAEIMLFIVTMFLMEYVGMIVGGTMCSKMSSIVKVFVIGDVMLGRGIDQILRYSCNPKLYEGNGLNAQNYVSLAVIKNGPLPNSNSRGVSYVWGDALDILKELKPDVRIINLENSITTSDDPWPAKGIHYRMHPGNMEVIKAADIDCCVLSNNHTADWGFPGLLETLSSLKSTGITYTGAGHNIQEAQAPAIFDVPDKGRVLVFAAGHQSSGIPDKWTASPHQCGLNVIEVNGSKSISQLAQQIRKFKRDGDVVILSIHWGSNWGYDVDPLFRQFAHDTIDQAGVDLIHGHSSHHALGVELYNNKVIIYGSGDFINDYEGIDGYEEFRGDLSLMYFVSMDMESGNVTDVTMIPTEIHHLQVHRASPENAEWLTNTMKRECRKLGSRVIIKEDGLHLKL